MSVQDLPNNLRLLCGYGRSVSDICRRAGINRHQFERYLGGTTTPSMHTLRRICDFFGLEDHELLLDHRTFSELVRMRPPRLQRTLDRNAAFMEALAGEPDLPTSQRYVGFYHLYFQPDRQIHEIHRCLMRVKLIDRTLISKTLERYPRGAAGLPSAVKYTGIILPHHGRLIAMDRQVNSQNSVFFSILYSSAYSELTYLSGLVMGVTPDASETTYCLRTVWHYLGTEVDLRHRLAQCGQLPFNSPEISEYLRYCISNDLGAGDDAFTPRA
jgi:transcriptional regulator with XRE-family HTH domain